MATKKTNKHALNDFTRSVWESMAKHYNEFSWYANLLADDSRSNLAQSERRKILAGLKKITSIKPKGE